MDKLNSLARLLPAQIGPEASSASDIERLYETGLLAALLEDRTTGKNIIWATDSYQEFGQGFNPEDEIDPLRLISNFSEIHKTRLDRRGDRAKKHGEVFTPLWICAKMCDHAHEILHTEDWQKYVKAKILEIACGEAPFLTSRRDQTPGGLVPLNRRVGLLDRKIRLITENVRDETDWLKWVFIAYQAAYGYEFQGDNLLLARVNLLKTFEENLWQRWGRIATAAEYKKLTDIIVWNIWQMDGLTGTIPYGEILRAVSLDLFGNNKKSAASTPPCLIKDWQSGKALQYLSLKKGL